MQTSNLPNCLHTQTHTHTDQVNYQNKKRMTIRRDLLHVSTMLVKWMQIIENISAVF